LHTRRSWYPDLFLHTRPLATALSLIWPFPACHVLKNSSCPPCTQPALFRVCHPVLVSYWLGGLVPGCWRLHQTSHWELSPIFHVPCFLHIPQFSVSQFILLATCLFAGSWWNFLRPWRWRRYVPPKRRLHLNRLHGVTSQKMILYCPTVCLEGQRKAIKNLRMVSVLACDLNQAQAPWCMGNWKYSSIHF
jgi:hypothetical protein